MFVLQAAGSKTWYVHDAPTAPDWALGELPDDERSPQLLRTVLNPGSVLYIPRAFAHRAVGAAGLSAHLSLTIRDVSVRDLRLALEEQLTEGLSLPARPLGDAAIADACAALLEHVRAKLDTLTAQDLRRTARARQAELPAPHVTPEIPSARETFADAAHDWTAAPGGTQPGPASVSRTLRKLLGAASHTR